MDKNIELVPCYTDRALFLRLAKEYVETLQEYDPTIVWDEASVSDWIWNASYIMEDRTFQGFIVTERVQFRVYPPLLYVQEFYIVPEARRRGIGLAAVKAIVEKNPGDVFLYILKNNNNARIFWEVVEARLGWRRIERPEIRQERGCELRVYQT